MAKVTAKAITRLQKFLAAIAGDATAPSPVTNNEKLLYNIGEQMKSAGASDLPSTSSSDNGKKMLGVSGGKWAKVDIPVELPTYSASENGKVLGVVDGALAWVAKAE